MHCLGVSGFKKRGTYRKKEHVLGSIGITPKQWVPPACQDTARRCPVALGCIQAAASTGKGAACCEHFLQGTGSHYRHKVSQHMISFPRYK